MSGPAPSSADGQRPNMVAPPDPAFVVVDRALAPIFGQFLVIQRQHLDALAHALDAGDCRTVERLGYAKKGAAACYQLPDAANLAADPAQALGLVGKLARYYSELQATFTD
jgi:hypothetical protein